MESATKPLVGPIQLVVIGFPTDAELRGDILRALASVRSRGTIRLIDALFVRKDAQGRISAMIRESDLTMAEREGLGAVVGGLLGLAAGGDRETMARGATMAAQAIEDNAFGLGIGDLQTVKDRIPPSSAALLLLIEHRWALELKGAVRDARGVPIVQGFLTPEALFMVGAELQAVVEAANTIAVARSVEGAAVLATLATVEEAERIQQAAAAETARVLIAAGLIEEAAAQDVIDTLVAADLVKREAVAEATAAVEKSNAELAAMEAAQTNGQLTQAGAPAESRPSSD
jgi:uncharacterized membrane protein